MEFAPPPPELKDNTHLPKGKRGEVRNRNGRAIPTKGQQLQAPRESASASERAKVGGCGLGEKAKTEHEDVGEGMRGRWRACLAESGKVGPSAWVVGCRDGCPGARWNLCYNPLKGSTDILAINLLEIGPESFR